MKIMIFALHLLLMSLSTLAFAVSPEHSVVTDFSRYKNEDSGLNGFGITYKLILWDTLNRKLGMQFAYNRLRYQYYGAPAEFRDRFGLFGISLIKPLTPYNKSFELEITPAFGLALQTVTHDVLIEDPVALLYGWPNKEGAGFPRLYFSPSLSLEMKRQFFKNKLGAGFGLQYRSFKHLSFGGAVDTYTPAELYFGYGVLFRIFYKL